MDRTFQKFLRSGLDLAPLGVERREENLPYFCTPKGAAIFGWAGVDGIHYCFIRGFGGMVFAVSPMNAAPDCVHPLARDFADFLRLLLACGDAAAASGADGETAGPGPSSGWKRSLTGRGAIGSSPRRMPAARGWSWTSACAQRRTRSAGS